MSDVIAGANVALCAVAALHFWKFHRQTGERLFGLFASAFTILGVNFILLAAVDRGSELRPSVYLIRLAAFLLIIAAIVGKNRRLRDRR